MRCSLSALCLCLLPFSLLPPFLPPVSVKWGKENYEVESVESLEEFQALLFSLTMVPPDRQKIMCKGKMIKDSAAVAALKEGDKLVLMGTADAPPKAPEKAVVFEEDLTDAQKVGVVKDLLSAGLHNLGNTSVHIAATCTAQQRQWHSACARTVDCNGHALTLAFSPCVCHQLLHGVDSAVHARRARAQTGTHCVRATLHQSYSEQRGLGV